MLKKHEDELRCIEEMERPAKEAAMKAERERKNAGKYLKDFRRKNLTDSFKSWKTY